MNNFEFNQAPLTSLSTVITIISCYFSGLFVFQRYMKSIVIPTDIKQKTNHNLVDHKNDMGKGLNPANTNLFFLLHNSLLSLFSLILLGAIIPIIYSNLIENGLYHSICHRSMAYNNHLNALYYCNYLMKLWELGDTFFLVARNKKLEFLHCYHHAATFLLTWTQLMGKTSVQWVPITINLGIHVLMYYYYAVTNAYPGIKIWWKKHLTTLQIGQFVIDLGFIYYCMYKVLFEKGTCQGDLNAGWVGTFLISSYLFLFVDFFYKRYILAPAATGKVKSFQNELKISEKEK